LLKYSQVDISDIALEVGFGDLAAFSKAFKKRHGVAPSVYRSNNNFAFVKEDPLSEQAVTPPKVPFIIEHIEAFDNHKLFEKSWEKLLRYAHKLKRLDDHSIIFGQILDDDQITDQIHCRYRSGLVLTKPLKKEPKSPFQVRRHAAQKYARFIHQGSHESSKETYQKIHAGWLHHVPCEMMDLPVLEFYPNDDGETKEEDLITEIYIGVK